MPPSLKDGRSEPHTRRFVCSNPNLQMPHSFDVFPGDAMYQNEKGYYICPEDGTRMFSRRRVTGDLVYPEPKQLYETMMSSKGFPYASYRNSPEAISGYLIRDRGIVSLEYIVMLRVSEALRLRRRQFAVEEGRVLVNGIRLSKRTFVDYRPQAWLPLNGERAPFTKLFLAHLETVEDPDALLFPGTRYDDQGNLKPMSTRHAWNVVNALTGAFNHFFRAVGEDYMVHHGAELVDLGGYLKVNPAIIARYVHNRSRVPVV